MPQINSTFVANTLQPFFEKKLLERAVQETQLLDYAQKAEIKPNSGNQVTFFRPETANLKAIGAPAVLSEGQAPTAKRAISFTPVSATLQQIGQVAEITDIANTVALYDYLKTTIDVMGDEFALDAECRARDPLCHATTGLTKRYAQGAANFATLAGAAEAAGCIVPLDLLDSMTALKLARAPKIDGYYVAYVSPQVSRDMINNADFRDVVKQNHANKIFKGEIGEFYGCKIVEGTVPFQEDETEGTFAETFTSTGTNTTGFIYTNFVLGKGAFGTVDLKKLGGLPQRPQIIINDQPDKSDPLNQLVMVGWKAAYVAMILQPTWGIALRSKSRFK